MPIPAPSVLFGGQARAAAGAVFSGRRRRVGLIDGARHAQRRGAAGALQIVTIFGGTGFLGRHIVQRLAQEGWGIRVATRRPELAGFLRPCGDVGQVVPVQANVRDQESIGRAVTGADAVVNLTGILYERGRQSFYAVHVAGAERIARATAEAGAAHLLHVSALGADAASPSDYARSKAAGEAAVREAFPDATVFRPSLVFGPEDDFFNRFAAMVRLVPVLPLFFDGMPRMKLDGLFLTPEFEAGTTRFQPVFVGDIADAAQRALTGAAAQGRTYELGGPSVYSYAELMGLIARETGRKAMCVPVPFLAAAVLARIAQFAPAPPITPDQVKLLRIDNIVAADAPGLAELGVTATAAELILPTYLRTPRRGSSQSAPVSET